MARKWSAEKIARVEAQAERLGQIQNFVTASPLFPVACVVVFVAFIVGALWSVNTLVDTLL